MKYIYFLPLLLLAACTNSTCEHHCHHNHGKHHEQKKNQHHHGHANHYMNQSDFTDLVERFENSERLEWQKPQLVIEKLGDLTNKTVVDIGAGTGFFAFKLSDKAKQIIAADADERFVEYMNDKNDSIKKANLITRKAEYDTPPINKNEADLVMMVNVYHHIENRSHYFKQLLEGLTTTGELAVIDFKKGDLPVGPPNEMKLSATDVIDELNAIGYANVMHDTTSLPYQYILKFNKRK